MKTLSSILFFLFFSVFTFSQTPSVCVNTGTNSQGYECLPSNVGEITPCATIPFIATGISLPPSGFNYAGKYEWFVNGNIVKSTTTPSDYGLNWQLSSYPASVVVKVYYYNPSSGTYSSPYTSGAFNTLVKSLNFNNIVKTSGDLNIGCSNPASFNLSTGSCTSLCYTPPSYTITWQPPAGWTQTNISANGNDVTFTPSATVVSPEVLTATITLPCGYTQIKTYNIVRNSPAPVFTTAMVTTCTTTASMSITPICGASNYTYTIVGNAGITFAANGLQVLTTTNTTVNFSVSGGASTNSVKVKANYPGTVTSLETTGTLVNGIPPQPGLITVIMADYAAGKIQVQIDPVPGATSYRWYKDGVLQLSTGEFAQIPITRNKCNVGYGIEVAAVNTCGASVKRYKGVYVGCDNLFNASPNPVSTDIIVSTDETKTQSIAVQGFDAVSIYDIQGNLKKIKRFNKSKQGSINVSDLKNGSYYIEISSGKYKERKQIVIQK